MPRPLMGGRERERETSHCLLCKVAGCIERICCARFAFLSRFPLAFSLFLLIAVSCVVFLCLFLLHLHHFAVLALLFRSQLVAIVPLSSSRLDSMRPSFRYGFQFRPEAPAHSSRTYAKLWFHLTNGQAINHKIKKHKFWQIESDDDCPTEVFEPGLFCPGVAQRQVPNGAAIGRK